MTTPNRDDQLNNSVTELSALTRQLATVQNREITRAKSTLRLVVAGLILNLLLLVGVGYLYNEVREVQKTTSSEVLCPLWERFLKAYNPKGPQAKADPAEYEAAFKDIQRGAIILKCDYTKLGR